MKAKVIEMLNRRGVSLDEIASIVQSLQSPYNDDLKFAECLYSVERVLEKREVQYIILTGLALDIEAEEGRLEPPIQGIIADDEPLYGVDETLAMGIATIYGTIGLTSFGYLDKCKEGILGRLNNHEGGKVNTFLDDIVAGIASAASARIAHARRTQLRDEEEGDVDETAGGKGFTG